MAASIYENVQTKVAAILTALALSINGTVAPVVIRKLPVFRDVLETLPIIVISVGNGPESTVPFSTGNEQYVGYLIQICIIDKGNREVIVGEPDVLTARESIRKQFQRPGPVLAAVPQLLQVEVLPEAPLSRAAFLKNYDFSALAVRFKCVETAS